MIPPLSFSIKLFPKKSQTLSLDLPNFQQGNCMNLRETNNGATKSLQRCNLWKITYIFIWQNSTTNSSIKTCSRKESAPRSYWSDISSTKTHKQGIYWADLYWLMILRMRLLQLSLSEQLMLVFWNKVL